MDATVDAIPALTPTVCPLLQMPRIEPRTTDATRLQGQLAQMAALADLIGRIESAADLGTACRTLANELHAYLSAEYVFVGLCRKGATTCRLAAISNVVSFHPRQQRVVAAQAVLQEVIARGEPARWPATDLSSSGGLLAHRQFALAHDVSAIVSGPLRDASGQLRGAWMVTGPGETVLADRLADFLLAAEPSVASALQLIERAEAGRLQQALRAVQWMVREKRGQAYLALLAAIAIILCIPVPYRPYCDCTVEPVTRRYVAAPFAGPLDKAFVEPGNEVAVGHLLARMDGREVRWELAGTRADLHRADKERAGHVATHELGQAEVARFEVDRLRMRTELLEHREQNLEIRSPIAGVVVSGDLKDTEGMPLDVGQSLFEIAPLDAMVVEVSVAEDDYRHVRAGMRVTIRLDAYPFRAFAATIERIHPRTELRDDENVFVAEARLENRDGILRPGMDGSARIAGERHALGWILLRRPFAAMITWLGW